MQTTVIQFVSLFFVYILFSKFLFGCLLGRLIVLITRKKKFSAELDLIRNDSFS
jgi:hypothetical protein